MTIMDMSASVTNGMEVGKHTFPAAPHDKNHTKILGDSQMAVMDAHILLKSHNSIHRTGENMKAIA